MADTPRTNVAICKHDQCVCKLDSPLCQFQSLPGLCQHYTRNMGKPTHAFVLALTKKDVAEGVRCRCVALIAVECPLD